MSKLSEDLDHESIEYRHDHLSVGQGRRTARSRAATAWPSTDAIDPRVRPPATAAQAQGDAQHGERERRTPEVEAAFSLNSSGAPSLPIK